MSVIAVSLGDPAGIGPEIVAKAWNARVHEALPPFVVVGDARAIEAVWAGPVMRIEDTSAALSCFETHLPVFDTPEATAVVPGDPTFEGARATLDALEMASGLARSGAASALVTGPVSKAQLYSIGFTHPGQTEFVAERCGVAEDNIVMMLVGGGLRVVPVTIHIALAEVATRLSTELIVARGCALTRGLQRDFGIEAPRIAVAGLNPHAGESGTIGDEEARIIAPAIAQLVTRGIDAIGPVSPDALFTRNARASYDAALCMYHDQALIPLKTLAFEEGVNLTLGLPIVRTAPDHGTAFNIAGKNIADPGAMIAAIRIAGECAANRAREV